MLPALFFSCWVPVVYTYAAYPMLVGVLGAFAGRVARPSRPRDGGPPPDVTIVIAAYNEEGVIGRKVENCLGLESPGSRVEVIVVSDGSSDGTVAEARAAAATAPPDGAASVRVIDRRERRGKTACLNEAVPLATGSIVVHTDANTRLDAEALRRVVEPFEDPRVGCVVGELVYTNRDEAVVSGGEGLYWRYENFLKEAESALGTTITANGGIYAIRREVYEPIPLHLLNDGVDPLLALRKGYRVLFERRARAFERAASTLREEFDRRVRIVRPGLAAWVWSRGLLLPPRPWAAFQFLSHKLLRWLAPFFLIAAFALNVPLAARPPFGAVLAGQTGFYLLGGLGILIANRRGGRSAPASLPVRLLVAAGYFCMLNAAIVVGVGQFLARTRRPTWEKSPSTRQARD